MRGETLKHNAHQKQKFRTIPNYSYITSTTKELFSTNEKVNHNIFNERKIAVNL